MYPGNEFSRLASTKKMTTGNAHCSFGLSSHVDVDGFTHLPVTQNTSPVYEARLPRLLIEVNVGKYEDISDADIPMEDATLP